jgi:hypothetical protein
VGGVRPRRSRLFWPVIVSLWIGALVTRSIADGRWVTFSVAVVGLVFAWLAYLSEPPA